MRFISTVILSIILIGPQANCQPYSDDPDIYRNATQFIESRGFGWQSYVVTTEDGYHLTIFRIVNPCISSKHLKAKPVVLWHGIANNAENWLFNRKGYLNNITCVYSEDDNTVVNNCDNKLTSTLAYTLAACGWDVWLANSRGTQYGNTNINFTTNDPEFWSYSLTEQAIYDIPATIHEILRITRKPNLSYIGYSLGSTQLFILLSLQPQFEQYIRPFIALAPAVYMGNVNIIFKMLATIEPYVRETTLGLGLSGPVAEFVGKYICGHPYLVQFCVMPNDVFFGKDELNTDLSRLPVLVGNGIDTTSSRLYIHFAQLIQNKRFTKFNYGAVDNLRKYKTAEAPEYPLQDITLEDIYLINGKSDYLANAQDNTRLYNQLYVKDFYTVKWSQWNHIDFINAKYANIFQDFYILDVLKEYTLQ